MSNPALGTGMAPMVLHWTLQMREVFYLLQEVMAWSIAVQLEEMMEKIGKDMEVLRY